MKFTAAIILALPLLAVATPAPLEARQSAGTCNTGTIECCQQTISSTSNEANILADLLGIVLGPIEALLGLGCSPVSVVGVGSGQACSATPVCCSNNALGGLISIGCVPVSV
ncbi:fungal hydrophobin-domain-containing protein [Irpex rosettiformis]|uniref:Fungal hydrophobin-domain-containing protein n=1 Tax=Irpex rosettiformis TaxID=378272 RepID=A0ACB8UAK0_9APHY|nr:fungal hydrophobin-domain-containing protein [Irpex rosettiformis]